MSCIILAKRLWIELQSDIPHHGDKLQSRLIAFNINSLTTSITLCL